MPSLPELAALPRDGQHPTIDRDDVHDVNAQWRAMFGSYDLPRTGKARVDSSRIR